MNLVLSFVHPTRPPRSLGPYPLIRLDAEGVRDENGGPPIARYANHQWEIGGERYFRLDLAARVIIHFERTPQKSRDFGPYRHFAAIDGMAFTDHKAFAFVDRKVGDWFCYDDGHHWPVMVVNDASPAGRNRLHEALASLAPLLPGVLALWQGAKLLYLGRAAELRARLLAILDGRDAVTAAGVTAWTWEATDAPEAREAELLAEYTHGARSLNTTYGELHGGVVRASRLLQHAKSLRQQSRELRAEARGLRRN